VTTDDNMTALELAAERELDAVILNCRPDRDNAGLVTALRMLQPQVAVLMFSGYCGVPCHQLHPADACVFMVRNVVTSGKQRPGGNQPSRWIHQWISFAVTRYADPAQRN
jgi:hypothetical protein